MSCHQPPRPLSGAFSRKVSGTWLLPTQFRLGAGILCPFSGVPRVRGESGGVFEEFAEVLVDLWHVAWLEAEQAQVSGHAVRDVVRVEAPEAPERTASMPLTASGSSTSSGRR